MTYQSDRSLMTIFSLIFIFLALIQFINFEQAPEKVEAQQPNSLAFPEAVGYGAKTRGAFSCGGNPKVIFVTNTNDSGSGSLRDALQSSGPRIVIIKSAGTIMLNDQIVINNPCISIYGNKAPGGGIQLRKASLNVRTHDVIIRYVKMRPGDEPSGLNVSDRDGFSISQGAHDVIVDHSTMIWGTDIGGPAIVGGGYNITFSYNIMGEGIRDGGHKDGPHSMGFNLNASVGGFAYNITLYKNLITTSNSRMPQLRGSGRTDMINNVVYNWGNNAGEGSSSGLNLIGNTWRKGPVGGSNCAFRSNPYPGGGNGPIWYEGEALDSGMTQLCGLSKAGSRYTVLAPQPGIVSATLAYDELITQAGVGANRPIQDETDTRIIDNVRNKTGQLLDAGLYVNMPTGDPYPDSNNNGLDDGWESQWGLSDPFGDADGDGYKNIEEFLNDTIPNDTTNTPTPSPTSGPTAARLKFKVLLPDISSSINDIPSSDVQLELKDGQISVGTANVSLSRVENYFQTVTDASFNIPLTKDYSLFIKSKTSVGKLFNGVQLTQSQTLDCLGMVIDIACGELQTEIATKQLLSGDSDGFTISSGSYNKVDSADLQTLASQFNTQAPTTGPSADFNLDGNINISDLEILGKNYGQQGD